MLIQTTQQMNLKTLGKVKEDRHKRSCTLGLSLYEIFSVTKSVVMEISGFRGLGVWIIRVSVANHKICCGVITFI